MSKQFDQERLQQLQHYFDNQLVKVTVPPVRYETSKGTVVSYFNGSRNGYKFVNGWTMVNRKDLHLFRYQHFIIEGEEEGNEI